jgi:hypothetical protein
MTVTITAFFSTEIILFLMGGSQISYCLLSDTNPMYLKCFFSLRKAEGKHGAKETSDEQYGRTLERRFKSLVGEPEWARLDRNLEGEEGDDSDDEFFR